MLVLVVTMVPLEVARGSFFPAKGNLQLLVIAELPVLRTQRAFFARSEDFLKECNSVCGSESSTVTDAVLPQTAKPLLLMNNEKDLCVPVHLNEVERLAHGAKYDGERCGCDCVVGIRAVFCEEPAADRWERQLQRQALWHARHLNFPSVFSTKPPPMHSRPTQRRHVPSVRWAQG